MSACDACLGRRWLLERLAAYLERERGRIDDLLGLGGEELISAVGGAERAGLRREWRGFGAPVAESMRAAAAAAGLELVCPHAEVYPEPLRGLHAPPAVLSINGGIGRLSDLYGGEAVAIVGTRRPSGYGTESARVMARGLSAAGVTVVSGLAYGIDRAAHEGALEAGGRTVAVLAASAARPSPKGTGGVFTRLREVGVVISELEAVGTTWRWALQARNRLIAGLAAMTVLIEGPERSGAMITVRHADRLGRPIGVLPGRVGVPQAAGPNRLLAKAQAGRQPVSRSRVVAVRDAQDVLDLIYGEGIVEVPGERLRPAPSPAEAGLLRRIEGGLASVTMVEPAELVALSGLELKGWVVRGAGGALTLRSG